MLGMEHSVLFMYCDCVTLAVTLTRVELWPATPTHPKCVFSYAILDWAEALLLEAQISVKDFCNSLDFRCRFQAIKVGILFLV